MRPIFFADPAHVMLDTSNGQTTGPTFIVYNARKTSANAVQIQMRNRNPKRSTPWSVLKIPDPLVASFAVKVELGDALEFVLLRAIPGGIPNPDNPEHVLDRITVHGLMRDPIDPGWDRDPSRRIGGTFYSRMVVCPTIPTYMTMKVSPEPPVRDVTGIWTFNNAIEIFDDFNTVHIKDAVGLLPGTMHFCTILLADGDGRWFSYRRDFENPFVTLKRKMVVRPNYIRILNPGDGKSGEVRIRCSLFEANANYLGSPNTQPLQRIEIAPTLSIDDDDVTAGKLIDVTGHTWLLGPKAVVPSDRFVEVETEGTEFDGLFEASETAGGYGGLLGGAILALTCPDGISETVYLKPFHIYAAPTQGDFSYELWGNYEVSYE